MNQKWQVIENLRFRKKMTFYLMLIRLEINIQKSWNYQIRKQNTGTAIYFLQLACRIYLQILIKSFLSWNWIEIISNRRFYLKSRESLSLDLLLRETSEKTVLLDKSKKNISWTSAKAYTNWKFVNSKLWNENEEISRKCTTLFWRM